MPPKKPAFLSQLTLQQQIIALLVGSFIIQLSIALFYPIQLGFLIAISLTLAIAIASTFLIFKPFNTLLQYISTLKLPYNNPTPPVLNQNDINKITLLINQLVYNINTATQTILSNQSSLSSQKNRLEIVLDSIKDGIIALDHDLRIVRVNNIIPKLTGFTIQELQNQPIQALLKIQNRNSSPINFSEICQTTENPIIDPNEFLTLIGKNNLKTPVQITCVPSPSISELKCVLIIHEVSKEKSLQSIQIDFVSMASHELRTPLTSIIGYLSVFMEENREKFTGDQKEFLDRIMISAKQLGTLIENLLNVSKVERNAIAINTQPIDWTQFLTKSVNDNKFSAANKNITLSLELPPTPLPKVQADPIRITEVINNLINNAINYTPEGGAIQVGATSKGDEVITYIKDNGQGIPKESINHLFTKFFRIQGALDQSSNSKGTGLGLYLSKSIIDLHQGKIWVESEVGVGSTFYFSLHTQSQNKSSLDLPNLTLPALTIH